MIRKISLWIIIPLVLLSIVLPYGCVPSAADIQLKNVTGQVRRAVQAELDSLDKDLSAAAASLATTGLSGDSARKILNELYQKHPYIIDNCTTDASGVMVTIAPDTYSRFEGTDISNQDITIEFNREPKPTLSAVFRSVEEVNAVVLMWPIPSENTAPSSVSALFKPDVMLESIVRPIIENTDVAVNTMQVDGLNIYDSEGGETGTNVLSEPRFQQYKELVDLVKKMAAQQSGSGSYTYISQKTGQLSKKLGYWESAGLHGTEWRLLSMIEAGR